MGVSGIPASNLFSSSIAQATQNKFQQVRSEFQQLGQDLQSGNLAQAQKDYATLAQQLPGGQPSGNIATAANSPTNKLVQEFLTLGKDLQAGNLSAAQQDFAAIQQSAQQNAAHGHGHHHHRRATETQETSTLQQDFGALGQALQSGNLSSAQQAYATLQSDLQQAFPGLAASSTSTTNSPSASSTTAVNVTA
jgi:hypothetical protein